MKVRFNLRIAFIIILLCTMTICSGCLFSDKSEDYISDIAQAIEMRDGDAIMKWSTLESQEKYGTEQIINRMDWIDRLISVKKIEIKGLKKNDEESDREKRIYQGRMIFQTVYGEFERPVTLTLLKKDTVDRKQDWFLDWSPEVIFPGLNNENNLIVEYLPGQRGTIYDRDGNVLARDREPGVREYPQGQLTGDIVGFTRVVTAQEVYNYREKIKQEINALKENEKNSGNNDMEEKINALNQKRYDIHSGLQLGRIGLEKAYQKTLSGMNGIKLALTSEPNIVIFEKKAEKGKDVHSTLDLKIQSALAQQLTGEFGAGTAINPKTGELLGAVSTPAIDGNNWTDQALNEEQWQEKADRYATPAEGNFAQIFLPGSTQKLLTSIIGLNNGIITTEDTNGYEIYGSKWQPDTTWGGYRVNRVTPINGLINLRTALVASDNIYFSHVALDLGIQKYEEGLTKLGIGEKIPSALDISKSQISNTGHIKGPIALADTSYGQAQNMISPLQMNMYYSAMLNSGNVMVPTTNLEEKEKVWKEKITSLENINFLNLALEKAINITHPSGYRNYARIAGKTGTAEVGPDGKTNLGWVCGYDLNNPNISICLMVNHVENRGGSDVNVAKMGRVFDSLYNSGQRYHSSENRLKKQQFEKSN